MYQNGVLSGPPPTKRTLEAGRNFWNIEPSMFAPKKPGQVHPEARCHHGRDQPKLEPMVRAHMV